MVFQLVYSSSKTDQFDEISDIKKILDVAHTFNKENNITGVLLYRAGIFLQLLEGEEQTVRSLYNKISQDKRHRDTHVVIERNSSQRVFDQWSMAYKELHRNDLLDLNKIYPWDELTKSGGSENPIDNDTIEKILICFRYKVT